jgi:hypothetical protein
MSLFRMIQERDNVTLMYIYIKWKQKCRSTIRRHLILVHRWAIWDSSDLRTLICLVQSKHIVLTFHSVDCDHVSADMFQYVISFSYVYSTHVCGHQWWSNTITPSTVYIQMYYFFRVSWTTSWSTDLQIKIYND